MATESLVLPEVWRQRLQAAKEAQRALAQLSLDDRNALLLEMAHRLEQQSDALTAANQVDLSQAGDLPSAMQARLVLGDKKRLSMVQGLRELASLPDPIGDLDGLVRRPNGLRIGRLRVPLGVILVIFESRPEVAVDLAGLCLKSGNALILRGGKEARASIGALVAVMHEALAARHLPQALVTWVDVPDRVLVDQLLAARGLVDLAVPRGGSALIEHVVQAARVPVIETGVGNCHVYCHRAADAQKARDIVVNAKVSNPAVCNAMETLLIDQAIAPALLPSLAQALIDRGVQLRGCAQTVRLLRASAIPVSEASEQDFATEFLGLILAVRVVADIDEALAHIARYGTGHSEAIVTEDGAAAWRFLQEVDAAAVLHNASTRFTDGGQFGLGAEVGISTQKLHARGPMGLEGLTTYKYVVLGQGQIRP